MRIHTVVSQVGGVISLRLQAQFVGDTNDATDKSLIAAFGDPQVNIAGSFVDPSDSTFTFQMPTTEKYVGVTTQMGSNTANFMVALPQASNPNQVAPIQGPLDVINPNPSRAAEVWQTVVVNRITQVMATLRAQVPVPSIADVTV